MSDWVEQYHREQKTKKKGGPGSGHWGHAGRPGQRGGSAPGKGPSSSRGDGGHVGHYVPTMAGRQDRRVSKNAYYFLSKTAKPLSQYDQMVLFSAAKIGSMEKGVEEYSRDAGIGSSKARRLMTWARDTGILEKAGSEYKLTPLGKMIQKKQKHEWNDYVALMSGDQSMLYGTANLDAVGYWLYANWPQNRSTVSRIQVQQVWQKVTGGKCGGFEGYRAALESGRRTNPGKPAISWAHIADLDNYSLNPSLNREDFVDLD